MVSRSRRPRGEAQQVRQHGRPIGGRRPPTVRRLRPTLAVFLINTMQAAEFLNKSTAPEAWLKHARALRRSADAIWLQFEAALEADVAEALRLNVEIELESSIETLEIAKLLYGLSFETALKARIIQTKPEDIEVRVTVNGSGTAMHAEIRSVGVPVSQGHNLLALAEVAGIFEEGFAHVLKVESDRDAMRNICRDLGEVVLWRGRYPVPLASFEPMQLNPKVSQKALAHYLRDWLDPVLDELLK